MKKLLSIILMLLLASPVFGATYYVDKTTGSDSDSGLTEALAWETIAKVNDFAEATGFSDGDIIQFKRGETWTSDEPIGWDGAAIVWGTINGLTIQDYGEGALPRLDSNTQQAILISSDSVSNLTIKNIDVSGMDWTTQGNWVSDYNIRIHNVDGVTIDGVYCDGHTGAASYAYHEGCIGLTSIDGNIEVKNCTIQNMYKDTFSNTRTAWTSNDSHGLLLWYEKSGVGKESGTVSIHDNDINHVYGDCIQLGGIRTTTNIYDNDFTYFGEQAIDAKSGRYHNIYRNSVSAKAWGNSAGSAYYGATAFTGQPAADWDLISPQDYNYHDNYIYDTQIGFITSGTGHKIHHNYFYDIGCMGEFKHNDWEIYNNLLYLTKTIVTDDATQPVMASWAYWSAMTVMENVSNLRIYNNSIYISSANHQQGIFWNGSVGDSGNYVKNNIIQMTRDNASVYPVYIVDSYKPTIDYNIYHGVHSNRVYYNGTTYDDTEQAGWRTASSGDHELFDNPDFTTPGSDFTLQLGSPCIDVGATLGSDYDDGWNPTTSLPPVTVTTIDQDLRGSGWEIGAYVYDSDARSALTITPDAGGALTITPDAGGAITITY